VRAEAANSISLFGKVSASHLVQVFTIDDHWLVRRSIMTALMDLECHTELFEICMLALTGEDEPLREAAVNALGTLANSPLHAASLSKLLSLKESESPRLRVQVAYALKHFQEPEAKAAMLQLRQDPDHRVVGAAMEDLLP
jgi:HEAT repeat protein